MLDDDPAVIADAHRRGAIAASDCDTVMHLLAQAITVAGIDQQAGQLLMLHAAAIADPTTGRAVVAVAASGAGKTTFVRTLGGDRVYLTDETVAAADDLSIVPYPKPLSVHTAGQNLKAHTRPDQFGLIRPTGDYRMAALWSLERTAGPTQARLEPIPRLEAITTLAPQVSYLSVPPDPVAPVGRGRGRRRRDVPSRLPRGRGSGALGQIRAWDAAMRVRRVPVTDRIVDGDESVVLVGHTVVHLSALPTAILDAAADWTEITDLAATLETQFGPPPDDASSVAATERSVHDLRDQGLIDCD